MMSFIARPAILWAIGGIVVAIGLYIRHVERMRRGEGYAADESPHVRILLANAYRGDLDAQVEMAQRLMNGDGVQKNLKRSHKWFSMAAKRGHPVAQLYMGYRLERRGYDREALNWFIKAADQNHAEAMEKAAKYYDTGTAVEKNPERAFSYYKDAAEKGRSVSQRLYAQCLLLGYGTDANVPLGSIEMAEAARQGDPIAKNILEMGIETFIKGSDENISMVSSVDHTPALPVKSAPPPKKIERTPPNAPVNPDQSTLSQSYADKEKAAKIPLVPEDERLTFDEAMTRLNALVGLKDVKQTITSFTNVMRVHNLRQDHDLPITPVNVHMVFRGNPGTGKTTVARLLGNIFREIGVLEKGHVVEVSRADLIGEYIGQTGPLVQKKVAEALDGILFIDEAYSLMYGAMPGSSGYGAEAIATLLKLMEDNRDRLIVIVAGYRDEMDQFIESNPGLKSRFTKTVDFPDFSAFELSQIFERFTKEYGYKLSADAASLIPKMIDAKKAKQTEHFGNARFIRNAFHDSVTHLANRISTIENPTRDDLMTLHKDDINGVIDDIKQGLLTDDDARHPLDNVSSPINTDKKSA